MTNKRRGVALPPTPPARGASALVGQLIDRLLPGSRAELAPPGQRSGEGADSIGPYLREARKTRPASLE